MRTLKLWTIVTALLFVLGGCSLVQTETLEALFTYTPANPVIGETVTFDASTSTGENLAYTWKVDDDEVNGDVLMEHVFDEAKSYLVELTVTDEYGATETVQETIVVKSEVVNAKFTSQPSYKPVKGQDVVFDATDSTLVVETNGNVEKLDFYWNFGTPAMKTGTIVHHTFTNVGDSSVVLLVSKEGESITKLEDDCLADYDNNDTNNCELQEWVETIENRKNWDYDLQTYDVQKRALKIISHWIRDYEELMGVAKNVSGNELIECVAIVTFYSDTNKNNEIETNNVSFHKISESDPLQPGEFTNFSSFSSDCDEDLGPKARSVDIKILYCEYS